MRYVIDANIAAKWFLPEADSAKALQLREDFHNGVHELIAPDIYPLEVGHALTKGLRKGRTTPAQAAQDFQYLFTSLPTLLPHAPLLPRAFALSSRYRIAINDCLYVVLADREGVPLVTSDQKLINGLQATHPFILDLASLP
jgi:predicted nucleic acid-binding protein